MQKAEGGKVPTMEASVFDMLPNDLVVKIGNSVGSLCNTKDYVQLSCTSKRMHRLLTDPSAIVGMIESKLSFLEAGNSSPAASLSKAAKQIATLERAHEYDEMGVTTLDQVHFYEYFREHGRMLVPLSEENNAMCKVKEILQRYESVTCTREVHTNNMNPLQVAQLPDLKGMVTFWWGEQALPDLSSADALSGTWIEFFFSFPLDDGKMLKMPKRDACYNDREPIMEIRDGLVKLLRIDMFE